MLQCSITSRRVCFGACAVALLGLALTPGAAGAAPRFEVAKGNLKHNFGEVRSGQKLAWQVLLKNVGDEPAELREVKKGCSACSDLRMDRKRVPPGETARLFLRFSAGRKPGEQVRRYFVKTNAAGSSSTLQLALRWSLAPFIEVRPSSVQIGSTPHGTPHETTVSLLTAALKKKVSVRRVKSSSPHVAVGEPEQDAKTGRITLPVKVLPTAPVGKLSAKIVVETDYPIEPRLEIPVRGTVTGPFRCSKRYINFGVVKTGSRAARETRVSVASGKPLEVTKLHYDEKLLVCKLVENEQGAYNLVAALREDLKPGHYRTKVDLETNSEVQPRISLPVMAVVR